MSYGYADDTGPCEGRQASPSNPTGAGKALAKEALTETFVFRCTASEKAQLRSKAEAAGLPASTLLREALGLTEARRRKPMPCVDPALVLAVGRIGGNLNQIARWLNHAMKVGRTELDTPPVYGFLRQRFERKRLHRGGAIMDERESRAGLTERAHHAGEGKPAAPRQRRMSAKRKQEAVLRILRGEDLELVSRDVGVTAADLSGWRDSFLEAGAASLRSRPEDDQARELKAMREKIGEMTMANELLEAKIDRLEAGTPFRLRRSKR